MNISLDPNLFKQIGLDSGSLTMLGAVVHSFGEPGEYRGVLYRGTESEAVFYITADKNSPVAQVNIDLAMLDKAVTDECKSTQGRHEPGSHYIVNPKGYVVFHVSSGEGGYAVRIMRGEEEGQKTFDSRKLEEGDSFSAIVIRPGTYSITNLTTKAKGEAVVAYPTIGKKAYRPVDPMRIECTHEAIEPKRIKLQPGQGMLYLFKTPSRIKIELLKPDDGPGHPCESITTGWKKTLLPKEQSRKSIKTD
jgi:hypothetical protein